MGKRKLWTGVISGAVIGGLISLSDRETRNYTKRKLTDVQTKTSYFLKNPSEAVQNARIKFLDFNDKFVSNAENAVNALEQVEKTLDKVVSKNDEKKLN